MLFLLSNPAEISFCHMGRNVCICLPFSEWLHLNTKKQYRWVLQLTMFWDCLFTNTIVLLASSQLLVSAFLKADVNSAQVYLLLSCQLLFALRKLEADNFPP